MRGKVSGLGRGFGTARGARARGSKTRGARPGPARRRAPAPRATAPHLRRPAGPARTARSAADSDRRPFRAGALRRPPRGAGPKPRARFTAQVIRAVNRSRFRRSAGRAAGRRSGPQPGTLHHTTPRPKAPSSSSTRTWRQGRPVSPPKEVRTGRSTGARSRWTPSRIGRSAGEPPALPTCAPPGVPDCGPTRPALYRRTAASASVRRAARPDRQAAEGGRRARWRSRLSG